jgi:hypothetical protein
MEAKWKPPNHEVIKVNVDAGFNLKGPGGSTGVVFVFSRIHPGKVYQSHRRKPKKAKKLPPTRGWRLPSKPTLPPATVDLLDQEKRKSAAKQLRLTPPIVLRLDILPNGPLRGRSSVQHHVIPVPLDAPEDEDDSCPHVSHMLHAAKLRYYQGANPACPTVSGPKFRLFVA